MAYVIGPQKKNYCLSCFFYYFVSRLSHFSDALLSQADWKEKEPGTVYSPQEKETTPNDLPFDFSIFNEAAYLCIWHEDKRLYITEYIEIFYSECLIKYFNSWEHKYFH